jgi:hypothetical protein
MNSSFDSDDSDELLISLQLSLQQFAAEVSDSSNSDNDAHIASSNLSAELVDLQNTLSQFVTTSSDSGSDLSLELEKGQPPMSLNRDIIITAAFEQDKDEDEDQDPPSSLLVKLSTIYNGERVKWQT